MLIPIFTREPITTIQSHFVAISECLAFNVFGDECEDALNIFELNIIGIDGLFKFTYLGLYINVGTIKINTFFL